LTLIGRSIHLQNKTNASSRTMRYPHSSQNLLQK
jgi:hypothetical protein